MSKREELGGAGSAGFESELNLDSTSEGDAIAHRRDTGSRADAPGGIAPTDPNARDLLDEAASRLDPRGSSGVDRTEGASSAGGGGDFTAGGDITGRARPPKGALAGADDLVGGPGGGNTVGAGRGSATLSDAGLGDMGGTSAGVGGGSDDLGGGGGLGGDMAELAGDAGQGAVNPAGPGDVDGGPGVTSGAGEGGMTDISGDPATNRG